LSALEGERLRQHVEKKPVNRLSASREGSGI